MKCVDGTIYLIYVKMFIKIWESIFEKVYAIISNNDNNSC